MSVRNISALNGQNSVSATDTFQQQSQQNELSNVKLSLLSSVWCVSPQPYESYGCSLPEDDHITADTRRNDRVLTKWG